MEFVSLIVIYENLRELILIWSMEICVKVNIYIYIYKYNYNSDCHSSCLTCNGSLIKDCLFCDASKYFCQTDSAVDSGLCVSSCSECQINEKNTYLEKA